MPNAEISDLRHRRPDHGVTRDTLAGWGRYPTIDAESIEPYNEDGVVQAISDPPRLGLIPRGAGRSYGDSSLAPRVIRSSRLDRFIRFDEASGLLTCCSGVTLAEILKIFVPRGWFLPVTPGTKFVTVGGAIASDVHGKNHHLDGSFSDHLSSITVATACEGIITCTREHHASLFHATCGGMGLTGFILEATFRLKPVRSSLIEQQTFQAGNIEEALDLFEEYRERTYSVAWIDCLSTGRALGRSLLMLGEHAQEGALTIRQRPRLAIPVDLPGWLLNRYSIQAFNGLYYRRGNKRSVDLVHYDAFFYPLDRIGHWNRLYGKRGFVQYQLVIPKEYGLEGLTAIIERIVTSKRGSFLSVLKAFGRGNDNPLSFPMEGYTLALDFKVDDGLFDFLDELDAIVMAHGGRLYLTKDSRMSEEVFKQGYPRWREFMETRRAYGADGVFNSLQSQRLGI